MKMDQQIKTSTSRLFNVSVVDVKKDDIEEVIIEIFSPIHFLYYRSYQIHFSLLSSTQDTSHQDV